MLFSGAIAQSINLNWKKSGPTGNVGKISDIMVYKGDSDRKTLYASSSNGIFKSANNGANWSKISIGNVSPYVSVLTQLSNGVTYIATGNVIDTSSGTSPYLFDAVGNGVWYTSDFITFSQVANTAPSANPVLRREDAWAGINRLWVDESNTNKIIAGTSKGIRITTDNGATWTNPMPNDTAQVLDLDVSGEVVVVAFRRKSMLSVDGGVTFSTITGTVAGQIPNTAFYGNQFAIVPGNNTIIYAANISNKGLLNAIYRSTDKGITWSLFSNASVANFDPILNGYSAQGISFSVVEGSTDNLIIAGSKYFTYTPSEGWIKRLSGIGSFNRVAFDDKDKSKVYFATSSGAYRSYQGYYNINGNMLIGISAGISAVDVTSFSYGSLKGVGTSVNSLFTLYKPELGGDKGTTSEITGTPVRTFSTSNNQLFITQTYGSVQRSSDGGATWQKTNTFLSPRVNTILDATTTDPSTISNLKTPTDFRELIDNAGNTKTYMALGTNSSVTGKWQKNAKTGVWELKFSAKNSVGVVWVSTKPNDFSTQPYFMKVASTEKAKPDALIGNPNILKFTADLNILYVATKNAATGKSYIYRVANINALKDSINDIDSTASQITVNKIADFGTLEIANLIIDPNNSANLIVTLKGKNLSAYLYRCNNANAAPTVNDLSNFSPIMGTGLPYLSITEGMIDINNPDVALFASADGLYYSTDFTGATPTYTKDAAFPQYLPICFDQIKSYNQSGEKGRVFIGTLGGGVYTADFSIQVSNKPTKELTKFILYPNPASNNFTLQASSEFNTIKIYDFTGKLVSDKNMPLTNYVTVTQDLKAGIYLIEVKNDTALIGTQKLVITK